MNFTLSELSFFIVVPFGTLIIGGFVGYMITRGRMLENKKVVKSQYIFAAIMAIITFMAINFMEYKTTYLTNDYKFTRTGDGTPISECTYVDDNGSEINMTFINYEKYKLDNFDAVIDGRYLKNQHVSTHGVLNYIRYLIKLAGLILGCLFGVLVSNKNEIYCDQCCRYLYRGT